MIRPILIATFTLAAPIAMANDCGPDAPCTIANGEYHMRVPAGDGPHPVMIWFHGHRGNGKPVLGGGGLEQDFFDNGYVVVGPNGAISDQSVRSYPAREGAPRDDVKFTLDVLDDIENTVAIDRDRIYVSGFSAGGSMAWLLACEAGEHFAGMVSVAGALRSPNPTECAGLTDLPVMQIHGFSDAQVPFEGRAIGDWHQGSIWDSLERARNANGCRTNPDNITIGEGGRTRTWDASCSGAPVSLVMHDGGHGWPSGWTGYAYEFFEKAATRGVK